MIYILLLILKIIGILLLSIIGLILLLLCLVLFIPIRYSIKSDNENKIQASASITWYLHLLHLHFLYNKKLSYYLTIFGIKIFPKKEKEIKIKKNPVTKTKQIKSHNEKNIHTNPVQKGIVAERESKKEGFEKKTKEKKKKEKKKIKFTFKRVYDKIKINIARFKKNCHRIKDERTKRAFKLCKKELFSLLKTIVPRKIRGIVEIGMKDPSHTGEIYGLYSAFFPIHNGKIIMIPYFEKELFTYKIVADRKSVV